MIVQLYEIQTVREARQLMDLGVDHIGSVVQDEKDWENPQIREVVETVRKGPAKSSLIPLFNHPDALFRVAAYYRPDIIHFCEDLLALDADEIKRLRHLQKTFRKAFPDLAVMRTIPIPAPGSDGGAASLALARGFEPESDFFLTDTHLPRSPVAGFAGITGIPCDWSVAAALVRQSSIPVILAGGLDPENVFEAIHRTRPAGVDSCTGTNAVDVAGKPIRFQKDLSRVKQFVHQVRRAQKEMAPAL